MPPLDLPASIGISIIAATVLGHLAKAARQPLLLAYIVAGVALGNEMGFGWIQDKESIKVISEIGLILLLFNIGLEVDLHKLRASGRTLTVSGITQFLLCAALGVGFACLLGLPLGAGRFDALYAAVAMALASTMIVVKLLYDKFELGTLPGRISLAILVFQDIWAILFLAMQPNLADPRPGLIVLSFAKGAALVAGAMLISRYLLPRAFAFVAKVPELLLATAIAWCFSVSGIAGEMGLSREMGALVAGISLSSFPYNVDVIAKVINIRDFFVLLFFVGLGLQIPMPGAELLCFAAAASLFLVVSRFVSIAPVLYRLGNGLRTSLIPAINLCQMSEFSLVIAVLGLQMGHISTQTVGLLTFVFVITSVLSTYMINANHQIQSWLAQRLKQLGVRDVDTRPASAPAAARGHRIVFLGFFREASSLFFEMERLAAAHDPTMPRTWSLDDVLVIDFNPVVHKRLNQHGIACVYGDIASPDTLQHARIAQARVVVSSIGDTVLRGTTNERLLQLVRRLCPDAEVMVTANTLDKARHLYAQGADFVFLPRLYAADHMARYIVEALTQGLKARGCQERKAIDAREEILE